MNTTRRSNAVFAASKAAATAASTLAVALLATAVMLGAAPVHAQTAGAKPAIVQLPRVVITGHRIQAAPMQIVELPRVVVTVRRADLTKPTMLALAAK